MEKTLQVGKTYAVTSSAGCTVTDANGTLITTAETGQQVVFVAPTTTVTFSDDSASVVAVFKLALAKTRLFEQLGGGKLPAGYLPALFLENTGEQIIESGHTCDTETGTRIRFTITNNKETKVSAVHGGSGIGLYALFCNKSTEALMYSWLYQANSSAWYPVGSIGEQAFNYKCSGIVTGNGENILTLDTSKVGSNGLTLPIFAMRAADGNISAYCPAAVRLYEMQISQGAANARDYRPVLDVSGVPCLYDKVTRQPFYNYGSGSFIVGMTAKQARKLGNLPEGGGSLTISLPSDVIDENGVLVDMEIFTALSAAAAKGWNFILQTHDGTAVETAVPAGYMECEFLESSGTQYIDTKVTMSNESVAKAVWSALQLTNYARLYGVENTATSRFSFYLFAPTNMRFEAPSAVTLSAPPSLGEVYNTEHSQSNGVIINGEKVASFSAIEFETLSTCKLFGRAADASCIARIFSFSISRSGTSQLNYIPSIDAQGTPCMYDKVSGEAKLNSGSGSFICGMTAAQAVQLANLPEGGGELTVSLPKSILNAEGEITDAAVRAALNKAAENGWTITLQYYTNEQ